MSYYIADAGKHDIDTLVRYGRAFWDDMPYCDSIPYNPDRVRELLLDMIENHYLRLAKNEKGEIVGFIGFLIHPMLFNDRISQATEAFFYVHPLLRGERIGRDLLAHAEEELETDIISIGDVTSSMDMDLFYKEQGYTQTERTYAKWQR